MARPGGYTTNEDHHLQAGVELIGGEQSKLCIINQVSEMTVCNSESVASTIVHCAHTH